MFQTRYKNIKYIIIFERAVGVVRLMEQTSKHFLYPATLYVSKLTTKVTTILGSCVAVCLHDPVNKVGGINHFMLPRFDGKEMPTAKFGDYANRTLLERMLSFGAEKRYIQAKVFGGMTRHGRQDIFGIGGHNILLAEQWLQHMQIPLVARSTGGSSPRKLVFNTQTGTVDMHLLLPEVVIEKQA